MPRRPSTAPTEIAAIVMLAWNAVALSLPVATFGRSATWRAMAQLAPEPVWAALFGIAALVMAVGLGWLRVRLRDWETAHRLYQEGGDDGD